MALQQEQRRILRRAHARQRRVRLPERVTPAGAGAEGLAGGATTQKGSDGQAARASTVPCLPARTAQCRSEGASLMCCLARPCPPPQLAGLTQDGASCAG